MTLRAVVHVSSELLRLRPTVLDYLKSRGLKEEAVEFFGLGYWAPEQDDLLANATLGDSVDAVLMEAGIGDRRMSGRIILPMVDPRGRVVGLIGRRVHDSIPVKYMYPDKNLFFDRHSHLYGIDVVIRRMASTGLEVVPVLSEGPMNVLVCGQWGFPVLGSHSSSFTQEQALMLRCLNPRRCILCPDPDVGETNYSRAAQRWRGSLPDEVLVASLPAGKDPAELVRTQGPEAFQEVLASARPM